MTRAERWLGLVIALAAAACGGAKGEPDTLGADADGDGYHLPGDCNDADPTVFLRWQGFVDADGDGLGAGPLAAVCTAGSLPTGYAEWPGDCDDSDAGRWQELAHLYRDADLDGVTVVSAGVVCSGASLPPGYANQMNGVDCDDADAARWLAMEGYADLDGDGVGFGAAATFCTAGTLPAGWADRGGDCAASDATRWQTLTYAGIDADGDGTTVSSIGAVCAGADLPHPYRAVTNGEDCDDAAPDVWRNLPGYADADADGVGAGPLLQVCSGSALRSGHAATGTDCSPGDSAAWRSYAYSHLDLDGDGRTIASAGTLCIGATVPAGYLTAPNGNDCDDANPAAWTSYAYSYVDLDGDGQTIASAGTLCIGATVPAGYRTVPSGNDCDDADPARYRWVVLYPDADGDGVGAPPRSIQCLGATLPAGFSVYGFDVDDANPALRWDGADEEMLVLFL